MPPSVYLAGPDVFLPDAVAIGERKKAFCRERGLDGLFPLDNTAPPALTGALLARWIYAQNVVLMRRADAIIANMTPFRGPGMDGGTAFEMGFFAGLGKPVFGYTGRHTDYAGRVVEAGFAAHGAERDGDGLLVEDFGLADNLMMAVVVAEGQDGRVSVRPSNSLAAIDAFEACVDAAAAELRRS